MTKKLLDHLTFLYGENESTRLSRTKNLLSKYRPRIKSRNSELSEQDSILITYGDQIQALNEKPLQTLRKFCEIYLTDTISGIHILPFYPWTSDDGFSVVDYRQIDPALGNWNDVQLYRTLADV
jgi:sucrose phosphorylase